MIDAEDLIAVMQQVRNDLEKKLEITGFGLLGYSLGGTDAAFVAERDSRLKEFDFLVSMLFIQFFDLLYFGLDFEVCLRFGLVKIWSLVWCQ